MRVLITGASGAIGTSLRKLLKVPYPNLRLSDIVAPKDLQPDEDFVAADLADLAAVDRATKDIDAIAHFGGHSVEGTWEQILNANIVGCYNLFEAARRNGVKRIIFASSNHAVGYYPRTHHIGTDEKVRPDSRYGVSKAFGEALGAMYVYKHGLSVTSLRIGNFADLPLDKRRLSIWLHPEDLVQLIQIGFEHPDIRCEIFYGASLNERTWWDNSNAYKFGYRPKHRAEDHITHALAEQAKLPANPVGDFYQGGTFCAAEFDGPTSDIWK